MSDSIILNPEQMKEIARFEKTINSFNSGGDEEINVAFSDHYQITLDDLYAALNNMLKKDITIEELGNDYIYAISEADKYFGLEAACNMNEEEREINGLPVYEEDTFNLVWLGLEDIWTDYDTDDKISDTEEIEEFISDISIAISNRGKSFEEMEFTDEQKYLFASDFIDESRAKYASEAELILARRFIDEFCEKDDVKFLDIKGYCCYGGTRLYECDWIMSRDLMKRLYKLTEDPHYLNTLGYIYYYGRCNNGKPEYEKAFKCFSMGAANGYYESMYKLADMFRNGYGCKKSDRTAWALYDMVYTDLKKNFINSYSDSFADAALRMGIVYSQGIYKEKDPEQALAFLYQAEYANNIRMKNTDFFGNKTVAKKISEAIEEIENEVDDDFFAVHQLFYEPYYFEELVDDGYRASLTLEHLEDGKSKLIAERIPKRNETSAKPIFITDPHVKYCKLVTKVEYIIKDFKAECFGEIKGLKFDYVERNISNDSIEFWYDDSVVCRIYCNKFLF